MPSRAVIGALLGAAMPTLSATAQETLRVSVDSSGGEGNGGSYFDEPAAASADGKIVAFASDATNLVAGDTNALQDLFVHDRTSGVTERVDVDSAGAEANGHSSFLAMSADGQIVAFHSSATNLVAGDTNGWDDVFVHDRTTGVTERVSVDSTGAQADWHSRFPSISADGRVVAFWSSATNLVAGDTNARSDVFVHDRVTGITERVSVDSAGAEENGDGYLSSISADGQVVAFYSQATNLVAGDANGVADIFVHDRATGLTERVSVASSGTEADGESLQPSLSADGQIVAFASRATNLIAHDMNGICDVFVHDRTTGKTERVSVRSSGAGASYDSYYPSLSADGRRVAFESLARNLVAGDSNGVMDVFVHDRATAVTERVSISSMGVQADDSSYRPAISAGGGVVAFTSFATNLIWWDSNALSDVFVHEACSLPASWSNYGAGFPGTNGVPAFTSQQNPRLGSTITLDLANSYGIATYALLFVGFQRTSVHSNWGGELLVVPAITLPVNLDAGGSAFTGTIPPDVDLCGFKVDLQAIEVDPGAAKGVSFTAGLELVLGS